MKITPLTVTVSSPKLYGEGTGKYQGNEIFPATKSFLKLIKTPPETIDDVVNIQKKTNHLLPDKEQFKNLREYQLEDVKFLSARKCCGCFNEQRTGKTPTALSTMKANDIKILLIVAPASTLYNWAKECRRWWSDTLPIYIADGTAAKRKAIIDKWDKGALIISYECLREVTKFDGTTMKVSGDLAYIKKHREIQGCILDEAHRIKNHKSKQAQALFSLDFIPYRMALTGTPAPGKQHEIFSILHWLYPNIFTGYWRFINYYFTQYEEYNMQGKYKVIGTFKPGKAKELQEFLSAISTRRLRSSVMKWLPDKDREVVKLPQTKDQIDYIKELNANFEIEGTNVDAANILAKLIKIRQILLAPELLELKGKSPKIEWIKQYLKDYPDKNILIFSNFTEWLKLLGKEIGCDNFIIGETSKSKREQLKNDFQDGKIKVLLINIKAGKEGITLDNADVAIFTDKFPPVGDILQAEDRFVATTKDKLDTGHTIIDLVMEDSYEEAIMQLLSSNAEDIDIINNYINYLKGVR